MPDAPARILMTTDAVGGVWTYTLELARGLGRTSTQVLIVVMGGGVTGAHRAAAAALPNARLVELDAKLEWMREPWADVERAGRVLLQLEAEFQPALIHLNGYAHAALPWCAPVIVVAHSCVLSWFTAVTGSPAPPEWDRYRAIVAAGVASADLLIAPTVAMLEAIESHYGRPRRARVIHNGSNPKAFHEAAKEPFILTAGRLWDGAKNLALLDLIASELELPVYVAGDPAHPDGGDVANASQLHALGQQSTEELSSWYARASIYALPALYEPFGLSALEAAFSGCTLVLSDIPSLREVWGDSATFVPPGDAKRWRDTLNRLALDPASRRSSRQRALELTTENMTSRYLESYRQLLQANPCESLCSVTPSAPIGTMGTPTFFAV